jgi:hypothetical protein
LESPGDVFPVGGIEEAHAGFLQTRCWIGRNKFMPIDERWDKLSDGDWTGFAATWVEQLRSGVRPDERDYGDSVTMMTFTARPEQQWKFLLASVAHAESDDELGHIAAGPIERLLGAHGETYIDAVEKQSADDPKFARAVGMAWKYMMSDEIWARVQAIQQRSKK